MRSIYDVGAVVGKLHPHLPTPISLCSRDEVCLRTPRILLSRERSETSTRYSCANAARRLGVSALGLSLRPCCFVYCVYYHSSGVREARAGSSGSACSRVHRTGEKLIHALLVQNVPSEGAACGGSYVEKRTCLLLVMCFVQSLLLVRRIYGEGPFCYTVIFVLRT